MGEASTNDPSSSSSGGGGGVEEANDSPPSGGQEAKKSEEEQTRQGLFKLAMQGKWSEVVQLYKEKSWVQGEKLTRAEDTTLHVAISAGDEQTVLKLLDAVGPEGVESILEAQNDSGSTPLHLAAAFGMDRACGEMARRHPNLATTTRNNYGETPIFTAVRHGKKTAFFALESSVQSQNQLKDMKKRDVTHCRREKDGNTILHYAIFGEYFELAYEIIVLYPTLIVYVNTRGESPLHYLANKPLCFKSETRFSLFDQAIYSCIIVGALKTKFSEYKISIDDTKQEPTSCSPVLPETFDTFSHIFTLLKPLGVVASRSFKSIIENNRWIRGVCGVDDLGEKSGPKNNSSSMPVADAKKEQETVEKGEEQDRKFPEIYDVGFALFKVVMKFLLVVLGIGLWRAQALERRKRKNKHACHLMDKLLESCKEWEYEKEKGGMRPHIKSSATDLPRDEPSQEQEDTQSPSHDGPSSTSKNGYPRTEEQRKNERACQLMDGLIKLCKEWEKEEESSDGKSNGENHYGGIGKDEQKQKQKQKEEASKQPYKATPVLLAARNGITEMVKKILDTYPVAILDVDEDEKNIVLLAVEHRQSHIYEFMLKRKIMKDSVFGKVDKDGNSALHLAARFNERLPWSIPGAVLQMQWEIKWYKYVMQSMELEFFPTYNNDGRTAQELFAESHKALVKEAGEWLLKTSESCSVVAALIAGVAFASAATVPGGLDPSSGDPILSGHIPFQVFAFSSLVALCFSVTSLIMFLTILTSRYQGKDFGKSLPAQLIFGLTSLFTSIAAMLVSFSAGDFFIVEKKLKYAAFAIYGVMFLPVSFFAIAKFPLYVDLIRATVAIVPERTQKMGTF